ncbi:MAG: sugar phosphate nucleotidyltransferase [Candidatus Woesearchaeota archaeon]
MKERITLTIEEDILTDIDSLIDGSNIKNRSHAVELLLLKSLGHNTPKKAIILAGGNLSNIYKKLPRGMVKIQNKPLIEWNIRLLKKFNIIEIIISIGDKGQLIKDYFGDGSKFGVKITYVEEPHPLGTSGPLIMAKPYLTETFIMCNGDELKNIDIIDMYNYHKNNKGLATIALSTLEDPTGYGIVLMNGNRIVTFVEKPDKENALSNLVNAGFYIMEPEIIKLIPEGFGKLENDLFPKLARENKLYGYVFSGQWFDTNNKQQIENAEREWKE